MTDDDVVQLLERAAALAPDRLDRDPVAAVARRRGRRRAAVGGAGVAAVALLGVAVGPGLGAERQVLTPAGGSEVATEFFDLLLPANRPDGARWQDCLELPGADMVAGPASMSPRATVSAVGTDAERAAVQQCLQDGAGVVPVARPDLRAVRLSVQTDGLGPLMVSVTDVYPEQMTPFLTHDLTVQNTSSEPVHVDDPGFGEVLPGGLFVGIDCSPSALDGEVVPGCFASYSPFTLGPGETRTVQVRLASGRAQGDPLPEGEHVRDVVLRYRTSEPFRGADDTAGAAEGRVSLTWSVTGPSAPVDPARAAFRPEPDVFQDALIEGELGGDPASGCLWLTGPSQERRPVLVLSDTARADFSTRPFRILDGDGVLAVEGEQVLLGGGFGLEPAPAGCPVSGGTWTGYFPDGTAPGPP